MSHEYATPYLSAVQKGFDARLAKLPTRFSVSQLLDTWETSVRQACAPKAQQAEKAVEPASTKAESTTAQTGTVATSGSVAGGGIPTSLISSAAS